MIAVDCLGRVVKYLCSILTRLSHYVEDSQKILSFGKCLPLTALGGAEV
jgi:hypothetical protein